MTELEASLQGWMELSVDEVFDNFSALEPERQFDSGFKDTRFLYIPGARADRVLLVAHADTVYDDIPGYQASIEYTGGVYSSKLADAGIGADDRAGCALLWELNDLGHSLLITSGEEKGCIASRAIAEQYPGLMDELNGHRFMVQFDRRHATDYKCYDIGTDTFRAFVEANTGYTEPDRRASTDIRVLARDICGVNISVGYYNEHTPQETLVFSEWHHTLETVRRWLSQPDLPRFERRAAAGE
jgi:hypothetical protein